MTLTREQVIEMAKQAGLSIECHNAIDGDEVVQEGYFKYITDEIERLAAIAYTAGRAAGLGEAVMVCKSRSALLADVEKQTGEEVFGQKASTASALACAIEQLKEQSK